VGVSFLKAEATLRGLGSGIGMVEGVALGVVIALLIAMPSLRLRTTLTASRLQRRNATGEMGFRAEFAQQQS
jgi:hypothetical protein